MDAAKTNDKRILILGSAHHTRLVKAHNWDNLPCDLNVADYDVVIMDFTPFANGNFAAHINLDCLPSWQQFARQIYSLGSEVFVIGSPNFQLGDNPYVDSMWWLPIRLGFNCENGETVKVEDREFAFYFELVDRWTFHFTNIVDHPVEEFYREYLRIGAPGWDISKPNGNAIARTRFGGPIAFSLFFEGGAIDDRSNSVFHPNRSGSVIWLPAPTLASSHDAIDLILKNRYGLCFEKEEPTWARGFALPSESQILERIREIEAGLDKLNQELETACADLADKARFRKLLYEQGEDVLEPIVRDALRELGAQVDNPKVKKREDGRLIDAAGRRGMLEIKGKTGSLALADVRQLDNWVRDAIANDDWHSKGLLIANLQCGREPRLRGDFFPPNCISAAKNFGICLLTTTQLFHALVENQKQRLDRSRFWDQLFAANGLCLVPDL